MKKLLFSFVMLMAAVGAWAEYVEVNGLRIYLTSDQYAQVEAPETGVYTGDVVIPSSVSSGGVNYPVKVICAYAFQGATITSVSIPSSVERIENNAFQNCASLTAITLPEGLKYISYSAFDGCPLTTVTIPGTVTSIRYYAFPETITSLTFAAGEGTLRLDGYAFGGRFDNSITDLVIERNYQDDGRVELSSKIKRVTIGDAVTTIPECALGYLTLESLTIGSNVTEIGQSAFSSTTLPAGYNFPFAQIKKIGSGAFSNCVNLPSNIDLTGVEEIGSYAFRECSLQSVILPMDVTSFGNYAFNISSLKVYAPWLTSPVSLANQYDPESHDSQFSFSSSTLYVPAGTMATYQAQVGWKDFSAIEYWSFNVTASVTGKGSLKMSNGEAVHANGTNTEKTVTGTKLVAEGASDPVSGLFVREKDLVLTSTPARGYELNTLTANSTDVKAAGKVENLLADQTIAAEFTPIIYTITYNNLQNGVLPAGQTNPATYTVEDNEITLVNPTRTAYNFMGWTGTDLTEPTMNVVIPAGSIENREYTAVWEPIVYPITYDLAGGAVDPANLAKYTIETPDFTLTNPTKLGYTFTGWTGTDLTDATMTVTVTTGHYGNRGYTATWEPNPYKVRFDINGGDGTETMADMDFLYDAAQNLTANAFTRTGYTFKEWNSKADGTGTVYTDGQSVVNLTAERDEVVIMYAQWTPNPYQVAFYANEGEGTMANQDFIYDAEQALTENAFTRTGYTFKEWNTAADGSGISYADKASVKNLTAELNGIVDVFAQWEVIPYTIGYDLAGGTLATANPTEYNIETPAFTLKNPTREGYNFAGWTGTGLSTATMSVTIAQGSYGDRTYTATWTPIEYSITYNLDGGTVATANPATYTIETPTFTLNNPTKEHWVFAGWTGTDLGAATMNVQIAVGSMGEREYTATWERETYNVTLNSNIPALVDISTITPLYEDDVVVTIADDEDYELVTFTVDGVDHKNDLVAGQYGSQYIITSVSADVTVEVMFNATKAFIHMDHAQQTFSCTQPLDFTGITGLKAYIASGYSDGVVLLTQVDKVPANTGLFLVGTEGLDYKVPFTANNAFYSNLLKPVTTARVIPTTEGEYTNYLYGEVNGEKGFFKSSGSGEVAAGKAYLQLPTSAVNGARVVIVFDNETTGISNANANVNLNEVYDLRGRKVADEFNPKRLSEGVYIVNGKKVIVKK